MQILLLCYLISFSTWAENLVTVSYEVKENESLTNVYEKFSKKLLPPRRDAAEYQKTLISNPEVKNWEYLKPGQKIKIYFKKSELDQNKVRVYNGLEPLPDPGQKEESKALTINDSRTKVNLIYLASYGKQSQSMTSGSSIDFTKTSPVGFIILSDYQPKGSKNAYQWNIFLNYYAKGSPSFINAKGGPPLETAINFLGRYNKFVYGFSYEIYHSFNEESAVLNNKIIFDRSQLIFGTIGYQGSNSLIGNNGFMRFTLSYTLNSQIESLASSLQQVNAYTGLRLRALFSGKITSKASLDLYTTYLRLGNGNTLSELSVGIGVGFQVF